MSNITALLFDHYSHNFDVIYAGNIPKPAIAKDTEVLVRVKAAAINPADLGFIGDKYPVKADFFPGMY